MPKATSPTTPSTSNPGWLFLVLLVHAAVLVPMALARLVDGDEGYYLLAAKLVLQGQVPYRDFLYTQMPLLPYVYALFLAPTGVSWLGARVVAAIIAIAIGVLVHVGARSACRRPSSAWIASLLYLASAFALDWFTVVKTYALSALLLLGAYLLLRSRSTPERRALFFAGVLFGLAIDLRSMMLAALPAFAMGAIERGRGVRALGGFALGIAVALLPLFYFVAQSPEGFVFGNWGYHAIRSDYGLMTTLKQKVAVIAALLGVHNPEGAPALQFLVLGFFVLLAVAASLARRQRPDFGVFIVLLVGIVSILPNPSFTQYYSVVVPFMILIAAQWLDALRGDPADSTGAAQASPWNVAHRAAAVALVGLYLLVTPVDVFHYVFSGQQVPGILYASEGKNWKIATIRRVSAAIDRHNPEHRPFLTFWPGYAVETKSPVAAGLENHFGWIVAHLLDENRRRRLKLISTDEVGRLLVTTDLPMVVGNWIERDEWKSRLSAAGYRVVERIEDTEISLKPPR